jgi:hypothetical protein
MNINKVTIKNFKRIKEQTYQFTNFDLLVGYNNSGKSTILQAMAIWQYCVDEFHRAKRKGSRGIQIVLPNFTALPLPEFNLIWTDKTERRYPASKGKKKQEFIYIEIIVGWLESGSQENEFGVQIRYQSPQSVYAIPMGGWKRFKDFDSSDSLPHIVYVPPFSGLETNEIWVDDSIIRRNIGKAQPGSVLRNLLFRVIDQKRSDTTKENRPVSIQENGPWRKIVEQIKDWFGVTLNKPNYEKGISTEIKVTYNDNRGKEFDIIAGGSGFHQTLTLLAFIYGWPKITTILFDEPDAHLHVNLQKKILACFRGMTKIQFLIATHAEELIRGVETHAIISVLATRPKRIQASAPIITALSDIDNITVVETTQSPFILYVEGEDDKRLLASWANILNFSEVLSRFHIIAMGGGAKKEMKTWAEKHFNGLREIVPEVERVMLFDYDSDVTALNVDEDNPVLTEWRRKNIENYLLVPDPWKRAIQKKLNLDLFTQPIIELVDDFFTSQNLFLPPKSTWENVNANIFQVVDGKKILFENQDSLFQFIQRKFDILVNRETVAKEMLPEEMHIDIKRFFNKLQILVNPGELS